MLDAFEVALELGEQRGFRAALQHLAEKHAAGSEHFAGEKHGGLGQCHDAQMIGLAVAGGVRCHVGEHDVGFAAEDFLQSRRRRLVEKIEMQEFNAGKRLHIENIEGDYPARGADALCRDLAPAAGRSAQIDHASPGLEHFILVVDLGELIGGARAKAFALGACHIRIAKLAFEPGAGRRCAAFLVLEPRHLLLCLCAQASPQTPSSRIISTSMPSRKPRSATRNRGLGKARRMASRMAQPASTRSARSAPIQGLAAR